MTVGVTGVTGMLIIPQLHFDLVPGTAVGVPPEPLKGYGYVGADVTH
jgi:hypothetical protein